MLGDRGDQDHQRRGQGTSPPETPSPIRPRMVSGFGRGVVVADGRGGRGRGRGDHRGRGSALSARQRRKRERMTADPTRPPSGRRRRPSHG